MNSTQPLSKIELYSKDLDQAKLNPASNWNDLRVFGISRGLHEDDWTDELEAMANRLNEIMNILLDRLYELTNRWDANRQADLQSLCREDTMFCRLTNAYAKMHARSFVLDHFAAGIVTTSAWLAWGLIKLKPFCLPRGNGKCSTKINADLATSLLARGIADEMIHVPQHLLSDWRTKLSQSKPNSPTSSQFRIVDALIRHEHSMAAKAIRLAQLENVSPMTFAVSVRNQVFSYYETLRSTHQYWVPEYQP